FTWRPMDDRRFNMRNDKENSGSASSQNPRQAAPASSVRAKPVDSAANPLVKALKSLHEKKGRAESGLFLAEGARLIAEAAECNWYPDTAIFTADAAERPKTKALLHQLADHGVRLLQASPRAMSQIARRDNPQTVIGAFRQKLAPLDQLSLREGQSAVALQAVRDPGNLGTIIRTCDAVGAKGVILIDDCCDPFSVEAVRATMGSLFAVPIVKASFADAHAWAKRQNATLVGAALGATGRFNESIYGGRTLLLMGNEQAGLPDQMKQACDAVVEIPMQGRADSLNLAVSTAVMLYEIWRQRSYDK
ncbi:MAG: RNA methyltransferase, partial [Caulobacterales bacterium]